MRRSLVYSLVGIILLAVIGLGVTIQQGNKPLLGLDLQGGASVVLQPQGKVDNGILNQAIGIIRKRVDALGVAEPQISRQGHNVVIELPGIKNPQAALATVGQTAELRFRPVLCPVATQPTAAPKATTPTTKPKATGGSTTVPASTVPGSTSSSVGLGPLGGGQNTPGQQALNMQLASVSQPLSLGAQATPSTTAPPTTDTTPTTAPATNGAPPTNAVPTYNAQTCSLLGATGGANFPNTPPSQDNANGGKGYALLPQVDQKTNATVGRYLLGPTELTGRVVSSASAVPPQVGSQWSVQVNFTNSGSPQFDALAAKYVNKQVAIVLDGVVESAPTIQTTSFKGTASITGSFTQKQANDLALQLRYGSLPVQFTPQSIQSVSATLGKDSLRAGLLAGGVGIVLVLLYMMFYYRALGVVVIIGLGISGALLYTIISTLSQSSGLSLSLAGATGIIVSVGVTVDSYIVYFERLKDDIRSGKSVRTSVDKSFSRAFRTILAADFVSFLAALILYLTTVGSVRGFAFFLGLSTLLDVFTAFFFTRPMVVWLGRNRLFTQARYFGVARGLAASPTGGTA
jgi:preprotein translocase subunit SecD